MRRAGKTDVAEKARIMYNEIMRKLFSLLLLIFTFCGAQAAGIYIKNQGHFTELIIPSLADKVVSISKGDNMIAFEMSKPFTSAKGSRIKDPFIKALSINGKFLTVSLFPGNDYTVSTAKGNIMVVVAKKKKNSNIKVGYGIEQPVPAPNVGSIENKGAEAVLKQIDQLMGVKNYQQAMNVTENFLKTAPEGYYKQEAYFRLGMIYLMTGKNRYNNYVMASQIFDDFLKKYPDSFRKKDAMIKSAEAKEQAQMYNEAIFAYNNVIKTLRTPSVVKTAYDRIAKIYETMGQYKDAVDTREQIIGRFRDTFTDQKAKIGMIQAKTKDFDMAYSSFLSVVQNKPDYSKLGPEELYTMGEVFSAKGKGDFARQLYEMVFSKYPSSAQADMSMYRSAKLLAGAGKSADADSRFLLCSKKYPGKKGGLLSAITYAGRHLNQKTSDQWKEYLKSALASQDLDIRSEAQMILIRALFAEKKYDDADRQADQFIKENYTSPYLNDVYRMRQSIAIMNAKSAYNSSNYPRANEIVRKLLKDYPDTVYMKQAMEIQEDISFGNIRDMFRAKRYKDTVQALNDYLSKNQNLINPAKWMNLLETAKYYYTDQVYRAKNYNGTIAVGGEYLASFPNGKYRNQVRRMVEAAVSNIISDLYRKKEYIRLISTYENSANVILSSRNGDFKDRMNSYTAFALYKAGLPDKASQLLDRNRSGKNPYYILTSLLLGRRVKGVDPNRFSPGMMDMLVQELSKKDPDRLIALLQKYTSNPAYAAKEIYTISKGVFDDIKREKMLFDLYMKVDSDPKARFDGYDEIYLDTGISFFKRNTFDSAVKVLEQFKLLHIKRDDMRAEGLYYLGKAYQKMGNQDKAQNSFMELMESVPKSVYASAAKSELEDMKWRKSLTK